MRHSTGEGCQWLCKRGPRELSCLSLASFVLLMQLSEREKVYSAHSLKTQNQGQVTYRFGLWRTERLCWWMIGTPIGLSGHIVSQEAAREEKYCPQ